MLGAFHPSGSTAASGQCLKVGTCLGFMFVFHLVSLTGERLGSQLLIWMVFLLKLWSDGWVPSFPSPLRALFLRLVLVFTCPPVHAFLPRNALKLLLDLKQLALAKSLTVIAAEME